MKTNTVKTRGVVYAATRDDRYVEEAFLSAESLKRHCPGIDVTLFTDLTSNPLCKAGVFDHVTRAPAATGFSSGWAAGQLSRLRSLPSSPYDRTLHLDTDTRIFTPEVESLFAQLDDIDLAMVETAPDASYSRKHYGKPMFSAGFILYRRNERTLACLKAWADLSERNFRMADLDPVPVVPPLAHIADPEIRRELLRMDQTSLVELVSPAANAFGLAVRGLHYSWNFADSRLPENVNEPIKILHSSTLKTKTQADILEVARRDARAGREQRSRLLYDYIAQRQSGKASGRRIWRKTEPEEWASRTLRNADLHLRQSQVDMAAELFAHVADDAKQAPYALAGQARVALRLGDTATAVELARHAAASRPESGYVWAIFGSALAADGRLQEAILPLQEGTRLGDATAAAHLGKVWFALENYAASVTGYRRALELNPNHDIAANNILHALAGEHSYAELLAATDRNLARVAWHPAALAFRCVALAELGRADEERALADLDSLITVSNPEPPAGMELHAFHALAAEAILGHATLARDPPSHATRQGWHTGGLADSDDPALKSLRHIALTVAEQRMNQLTGSDHLFAQSRPRTHSLHAWAVVMRKGSHQIPHIHPSGWLSGVYYIEVPKEIDPTDPTHSGWLAFGRAEERWHRPETRTVERFICPRPGLLVTFPSYFWHGTVPLKANGRRVSYAFDVVPR